MKDYHLDPVHQFESNYEEQVHDLTVLVKNKIQGWAMDAGYRMPVTTFIAFVDNKNGHTYESYGRLTWIEKESKSAPRFQFKAMETYRVKVRKNKENEKVFLLVDVVGTVREKKLNAVKERYQQPVVITSELGEFRLDRRINQFCGKAAYFGEMCAVYLEVEEGEYSADLQMGIAKNIFNNLTEWDEPLNYIDVFSRMQLEKLILQYGPTMLFVEHDTSFCEKIATRVIGL